MSQSESQPLSPISETLQRVTGELRKVTQRLEKVDDAVGKMVFESAGGGGRTFHDLQDLDRAKQEVAGIARFLERLAHDMPAEWVADSRTASLMIDLQELATSLARSEARENACARTDGDDCEMFV
ncbi:MAG: hypothetical protein E7774_11680 [Bradyrhizobium sp.]|nr:MAG: hypothetical protein E7774_11680 [Bradyrhizobium sp.]